MKRHDYIIGIDPDSDKSGLTLLNIATRSVEHVVTLPFPELIDYINTTNKVFKNDEKTVLVVVEASWLIKTNWHTNSHDNKAMAAAKGNSVGRNHETGRKIVECLRYLGIEVEEMRPLKKSWKGRDGKITHDEISYFIPGFPKRSNQEERDSCLIAWCYARLPVRVDPIKQSGFTRKIFIVK